MKRLLSIVLLATCPLTAGATTRNIWISQAEIDSLPTTTAAYTRVYNAATSNWARADMKDMSNLTACYTYAGALIYMKTGSAALRQKVRDTLMAAIRSCPIRAGIIRNAGGNELAISRQSGIYAIAADMIDLESFAPDSHRIFSAYMDSLRFLPMEQFNASFGNTMIRNHECVANLASMGAMRILIDRYIDDAADLARCDSLFRAYADQRYFPAGTVWFSGGGGDYFTKSGIYEQTWACGDTSNWTAISPLCTKTDAEGDTLTIDGAIVGEASRLVSGGPTEPFAVPLAAGGKMYSWTSLNHLFIQAEGLYRAGYTDIYSSGGQALRRCMNFMIRAQATTPEFGSMRWIAWLHNYRYGMNFTALDNASNNWGMYWTDWTHASRQTDRVTPAPITSLGSP